MRNSFGIPNLGNKLGDGTAVVPLNPPKKVQFSNFSIRDERKNQKENSDHLSS